MVKKYIFSPAEVAKILNVSLRTLQRYRDDGLIEFSQLNRKILFSETDIENFVKRYRRQTFINSKNYSYGK